MDRDWNGGAHSSDLVHVDDDRCARAWFAARGGYQRIILWRAELVHSTCIVRRSKWGPDMSTLRSDGCTRGVVYVPVPHILKILGAPSRAWNMIVTLAFPGSRICAMVSIPRKSVSVTERG